MITDDFSKSLCYNEVTTSLHFVYAREWRKQNDPYSKKTICVTCDMNYEYI